MMECCWAEAVKDEKATLLAADADEPKKSLQMDEFYFPSSCHSSFMSSVTKEGLASQIKFVLVNNFH